MKAMPLPNDILSVFPICILGAIACSLGLAFCEIQAVGDSATPFTLV